MICPESFRDIRALAGSRTSLVPIIRVLRSSCAGYLLVDLQPDDIVAQALAIKTNSFVANSGLLEYKLV